MPLPDASRLSSLPAARYAALGRYLAAKGVTSEAVEGVNAMVAAIPVPMRKPLLLFHARRVPAAAGALMRMFVFRDPVERSDARDALGDQLEPLLESGLLVRDGDAIVSPFILNIYDDLLVVVDDLGHGGDAVMGSGPTTIALTLAALPSKPVEAALDLGCGAGTLALALARHARRSVGVDVNPRAITIATLNAALNDLPNVEFRTGDLFAPVASEQFDVIVSQPPFVARARGQDNVTYMYGGERGDELALRALRELPPRLSERGRAIVFVEWPELEGDPIDRRVRAVIPADHDLFLLQCPPTNVDTYCAWFAVVEQPRLDDAFERVATAQRAHFERTGITSLRRTFTVVERAPSGRGLTATIPIRPLGSLRPSSARIEKLVAAQRLLAADEETFLAATLRVPKGTTFIEERTSPIPGTNADRVMVRLPAGAFLADFSLNDEAVTLVAAVDQAGSVGAALDLVAQTLGAEPEFVKRRVVPHAREALARGLLQIPARPTTVS